MTALESVLLGLLLSGAAVAAVIGPWLWRRNLLQAADHWHESPVEYRHHQDPHPVFLTTLYFQGVMYEVRGTDAAQLSEVTAIIERLPAKGDHSPLVASFGTNVRFVPLNAAKED